ncbi:MAG: type I methionyl aminopeptidase [Spirochaetes bacterium]|nr:type I methionyl aminopeptidase [Spirochaetota bacterium]
MSAQDRGKPVIKTDDEVRRIAEAASIAAGALAVVKNIMLPGIRADEIDREAEKYIAIRNAFPANKEVEGYTHATSVSRWDEIAHGIPLHTKIFRSGDVVAVDLGVKKDGCYADAAATFAVGTAVHPRVRTMLATCYEALLKGIHALKSGTMLSLYGRTVETIVKERGFSVVRKLTGHGVGRAYHEAPHVFNFYHPDNDIPLMPNMVFAFELMITAGSEKSSIDDDGWTARTSDGNPSVHFEHTVLIGGNGVTILG